jgi:hypothetical protein
MLQYGAGYWLRFSASQSVALSGTPRTSESVALSTGWNLIGSVSASVPVSSVTSSPANILASGFFGYKNGYAPATSIDPGMGYWIKANNNGTIAISSSANVPGSTAHGAVPLSTKLNSLTIRDAVGNSQTLYFGDKTSVDQSQSYELPPAGPDGSFDARFTSQKYVALHSSTLTSAEVFHVQIRAVTGPLTISWSVQNSNARYTLADVNGKSLSTAALTGNGSLKVANLTGMELIASASGLPKEYALHQNYPNPFNPTTTIAFDLPASTVVSLKVFNILGQEVATVLNGVQLEGGEHVVQFNASNLTSGIYFYQLRAGSFTNTKKLMLLK